MIMKKIDEVRKGENINFNEVYDMFYNNTFNWVRSKIGNKESTEELTNDIFIIVYKNLKNFKGNNKDLKNWIITITNNQIIDWYRANKNKSNEQSIDNELNKNIKTNLINKSDKNNFEKYFELIDYFSKKILTFTPKLKTIANMYFLEEYNIKEISEELNIPIGTVCYDISNIKKKIKI